MAQAAMEAKERTAVETAAWAAKVAMLAAWVDKAGAAEMVAMGEQSNTRALGPHPSPCPIYCLR